MKRNSSFENGRNVESSNVDTSRLNAFYIRLKKLQVNRGNGVTYRSRLNRTLRHPSRDDVHTPVERCQSGRRRELVTSSVRRSAWEGGGVR